MPVQALRCTNATDYVKALPMCCINEIKGRTSLYYTGDMDTGTSNNIRIKEKKSDKSRHFWSVKEEEVLQSLKDAATVGFKIENGFRCGYLVFLEDSMKKVFHGTNLRDKMIEATNKAWNDFVKSDNNLRTMRYKRWPYYNDWCEIFGHDRATGEHAESFRDVFQGVLKMGETGGHDMNDGLEDLLQTVEDNVELIPLVHPSSIGDTVSKKSHSKKRKHQMQGDDAFVEAINKFTDIFKNIGQDQEISKAIKSI